ncbi:MAG: stalk domain-containing protein [Cellulosilyticaceae bacterium]
MRRFKLLIGVWVFMIATNIYAQGATIFVNNKDIDLEKVAPQFKEEITYVPVSFIAKALETEVKWENPYIKIINGHNQIIYRIGSKIAYKNGIEFQLLGAPYIANGRTFVPLNNVGELLDCYVDDLKETGIIAIRSCNLTVEEQMQKLRPMDYCVVGEWVYYVTLGDQEGFHKMALDGSKDIVINNFSKIMNIGGSNAITSEVHENYILYKVQALCEVGINGVLDPPHPISYYKLNLLDNTIEAVK